MYPKLKIEHTGNGPWGQTAIEAQFTFMGTIVNFIMQGHATVTTNPIAVTCVQRGASFVTTLYLFSPEIFLVPPSPPQTCVLGVLLLTRGGCQTIALAAEPDETFTVSIRAKDILIEGDNGLSIREVHTAKLESIAALQLESEACPKPRTPSRSHAVVNPARGRILLPAP